VTWQIEADDSAPGSHRLLVRGILAAWNMGHEPATVGNVVVHLQAKTAGQWITLSSDVADATGGDAATEALIVAGSAVETVAENAASGRPGPAARLLERADPARAAALSAVRRDPAGGVRGRL
jgi:hypothetical protein